MLLPFCEEWGQTASFLLMAEGIEPEGRRFGSGTPEFRLIVDPVDGSRGLMHDKRSAWSAGGGGRGARPRHLGCATSGPR